MTLTFEEETAEDGETWYRASLFNLRGPPMRSRIKAWRALMRRMTDDELDELVPRFQSVLAGQAIELKKAREGAAYTFEEYEKAALRTAKMASNVEEWERELLISALGIAGEAGEVADLTKKIVGHKHPRDDAKFVKELGDVLWYVNRLAHLFLFPASRCGKYLGDNDGTCPQLTCIRETGHLGLCDNVRGDAGSVLAEVARRNIEKLWARYPNGFETEKSIHRTEE